MNQDGCIICGKEKKFKKARTCSRECAAIEKRKNTHEERECVVCRSKFTERKKYERKICSDKCRSEWNSRPDNIKQKYELSKRAVLDKYGVENVFASDNIKKVISEKAKARTEEEKRLSKEKQKLTKLNKYGNENFNNTEAIKKTKAEKYGDKNFNNRTKAVNTMKERLGVNYAMQSEEVKKKSRETNISRYGVDHQMKNEQYRQRVKSSNLDKYGSEHIMKIEEFKRKITTTWSKKITKSKSLLEKLPDHGIRLLSDISSFSTPVYEGRKYVEFEFQCMNCGFEFSRTFSTPTIPICRVCNPSNRQPKTHELIRDILTSSGIKFIENDRKTLGKIELDFFISEKSLAIEVNGNYFHSERAFGCDKSYHLNKTKKCFERGIKLIHIFEDELNKHPEIVKSRLKSQIGITESKLYARKLSIKEIDSRSASEFFEKNHIQGNSRQATNFIGLFDSDNNLVSAMSFGKLREALGNKSKEDHYELYRFCSLLNTNVVGGFSKMLNYFIKVKKPKYILTYADIRWSGMQHERSVYETCGFTFKEFTKPNFWYFKKGDYDNRHHRFSYRKSVLTKKAKDAGLEIDDRSTEWDIAQSLGMDRIWDCGSMKFELFL